MRHVDRHQGSSNGRAEVLAGLYLMGEAMTHGTWMDRNFFWWFPPAALVLLALIAWGAIHLDDYSERRRAKIFWDAAPERCRP